MANKLYIYTDEDLLSEVEAEYLEANMEELFGSRTFIYCEDGTNLLLNDSEDALMVMEYYDN